MALTLIEGNLSYISLKNTKAMFGPHPCTVMKLDEEKKYFSCKYLLNSEWKGYHDPNFDVENPTKRKLEEFMQSPTKRTHVLLRFSFQISSDQKLKTLEIKGIYLLKVQNFTKSRILIEMTKYGLNVFIKLRKFTI